MTIECEEYFFRENINTIQDYKKDSILLTKELILYIDFDICVSQKRIFLLENRLIANSSRYLTDIYFEQDLNNKMIDLLDYSFKERVRLFTQIEAPLEIRRCRLVEFAHNIATKLKKDIDHAINTKKICEDLFDQINKEIKEEKNKKLKEESQGLLDEMEKQFPHLYKNAPFL